MQCAPKSCDPSALLHSVLPNTHDAYAAFRQLSPHAPVSQAISMNLGRPVRLISFWPKRARGTTVPKTTVDEQREPRARKPEVRFSGDGRNVSPPADHMRLSKFAKRNQLRAPILSRSDRRHVFAARRTHESLSHRTLHPRSTLGRERTGDGIVTGTYSGNASENPSSRRRLSASITTRLCLSDSTTLSRCATSARISACLTESKRRAPAND